MLGFEQPLRWVWRLLCTKLLYCY